MEAAAIGGFMFPVSIRVLGCPRRRKFWSVSGYPRARHLWQRPRANTPVSDEGVVSRATAIQTNMTGNVHFPSPPADLAALKTSIDTLSALIAQALDGSKKVIAQKHKQRDVVIRMLRMLGRYVEVASNGDMAIFQTGGFQPASTTKTTSQ